MGNRLSPCFRPSSAGGPVKLVFWGGATKQLSKLQLAGQLMSELPDHVVCHAGSFYIGQPVPVLGIDDELLPGQTYFVLPIDRFPTGQLTAASVLSLSPAARKSSLLSSGECPFEYVNGADGKVVIKVLPEFITRVITSPAEGGEQSSAESDLCGDLCSTPELKKHYAQLVGPRDRPWSPKLETISEKKNKVTPRLSPVRLLGLERRK